MLQMANKADVGSLILLMVMTLMPILMSTAAIGLQQQLDA